MSRIAHCNCGSLRVKVAGEPTLTAICHCGACQRRTGSVFSANVFYKAQDVQASGPETVYERVSEAGRTVRTHFCPTCGTSVYYEAGFRPGDIAVTIGSFADPQFPCPKFSVWEESKHAWVEIADAKVHLRQGRDTATPAELASLKAP
jgi:hypothetical protein